MFNSPMLLRARASVLHDKTCIRLCAVEATARKQNSPRCPPRFVAPSSNTFHLTLSYIIVPSFLNACVLNPSLSSSRNRSAGQYFIVSSFLTAQYCSCSPCLHPRGDRIVRKHRWNIPMTTKTWIKTKRTMRALLRQRPTNAPKPHHLTRQSSTPCKPEWRECPLIRMRWRQLLRSLHHLLRLRPTSAERPHHNSRQSGILCQRADWEWRKCPLLRMRGPHLLHSPYNRLSPPVLDWRRRRTGAYHCSLCTPYEGRHWQCLQYANDSEDESSFA